MTHPTMFFFFFPFLSSLVSSECFQSNAKKKVFLHVDFTSSLFDKIKIIPFSYLPRSFISRIISCERSCIDLKTCDLKIDVKEKEISIQLSRRQCPTMFNPTFETFEKGGFFFETRKIDVRNKISPPPPLLSTRRLSKEFAASITLAVLLFHPLTRVMKHERVVRKSNGEYSTAEEFSRRLLVARCTPPPTLKIAGLLSSPFRWIIHSSKVFD